MVARLFEENPIAAFSRAPFDCAWRHEESYWLYLVEHAGDTDGTRLPRMQDPAGKGRNFSFDQGWRQNADFSDGNPEGGAP
jgi:hypothetical protein